MLEFWSDGVLECWGVGVMHLIGLCSQTLCDLLMSVSGYPWGCES